MNHQSDRAAPATTSTSDTNRLYEYEHLSDEIVQDWSDSGRETIKSLLVDISQNDDIALDVLVQELVEAATTSRIKPQDVGLLVKECIDLAADQDDADSHNPIQDSVLAAVSIAFADEDSKSSMNTNSNISELSTFLEATEISPDVIRIELDAKLMEQLGLIRSTFHKQVIRKQTNLLYRQANYNLLREESEGFSKLVTELFTTSGNEIPSSEVVEGAVERVKAMIGAFDLDVGRSLDVVLDVFGSVLVKQFRFFVKFLRASPWWPRSDPTAQTSTEYNKLSGLPLWALPGAKDLHLTAEQKSELSQLTQQRDSEFWQRARKDGLRAYFLLGQHRPSTSGIDRTASSDFTAQWTAETGTIPHAGSSEAAQLLGFKLRFHAPGAEGDHPDGTPRNLIYLAALLIKIGFISLHDLYPHLWRPDSEMDVLKQQKTKEKEEREQAARPGAGAKNALASAGALSDDTDVVPSRLREQGTRGNTPAKDAETEKTIAKEPILEKPDQKVMLLQNLLAIGALPEALFILGRFPWMTNLIPELPEYINRILHHSLSKIYDDLRPLSSRPSLHAQAPWYETNVSGLSKGQASLGSAPQRRVLRWPLLDREDTEVDGINYRFYWDEWSDNIPMCQTYDDVFVLCKTLLPLVGAKIGQDPSLILKFARIGKASLKLDDSTANKDRWLDLIKRIILPSISLTKANPGAVNEVYDLINLYSTETRYQVYLEWLSGKTSKTPDMLSASRQAMWETSDVLKKISKTNVKPMARALAKVAYSNPHVVIRTAFRQIESYDSIANVFVEGVRYFTDLGYDVLTWSLIEGLARDTRSGISDDGLFASKWLTALSRFAGNIYKRYNLMKPGPILQYVSTRLHKGISTELIMLEQLVVSMAGIAPDANYNDTQLLAMGGGQLLQSQTVLQLLDQRHTSKLTAKRLIKALQDYGLTGKFLLMMARRRQACIFENKDAPLKAVGHSFDETTRILGQYLDFLRTSLSSEEFQKAVPSVSSLLTDYDVPVEIAFWIDRPVVQKQLNDHDKDNTRESLMKDVNGDVEMNDQDASEEDGEAIEDGDITTGAATPTENEILGNADVEITDADQADEGKWHPVLKGIMDDINTHVPEGVRDLVGTGFYVSFWQLSLYDISVPGKSYEDEMSRTKRKIQSITADRSNVSSSSAKQKESQIKALRQLNEDLLAENKQHLKAYGDSKARLAREKDQWFVAKSRMSAELNTALMEYCFLPRMLLSHLDAYFCFKFAKMLHSLGTANFRTLGFYDLLFKTDRLTSLAFMCTSKEADHLGKFIAEVLKDLSRWHKTKATYEREAFGTKKNLPGFALRVENGKPQMLLEFEKFRSLLFKWHTNLYAALAKCLQSPEYMHVRNAISILRAISGVFPMVAVHGRALQRLVDQLRESDREDLKIASLALLSTLNRRQKEWVASQAFRQGGKLREEVAEEEANKQKKIVDQKPKKEVLDEKTSDVKMKDVPVAARSEKTDPVKEDERTPSSTSNAAGHRSPSRHSTPLPARPPRDSSSLRPPRPESRTTDLPRRVSPPPRFPPVQGLPTRPEPDQRDGYRETRPARTAPSEPPRSDSRTGYPPRHSDRAPDTSHEPYHRLPRPTERPSMLDRDERPPHREHDSRAGYEERRYAEREPRTDREPRPERESRHERDHTRSTREYPRPERPERSERSERSDREYSRPATDHTERPERSERSRREETQPSSRRDAPSSSRNATPVATAPSINPERAALIHGPEEPRPGMSIRGQAQEKNRSSRPTSPRREDDRKHPPRSEREDRQERRPEPQVRDAPQPPVSVPSRPPPASGPPRERGRPAVDLTHGRLEQDNSPRPPPRSERAQDAEPPSGPRSRPPSQPVRSSEPMPPQRPPPQNRQPPSGPGRGHSRNASYADPPAASPTGPDTTGIHPDRLNHIAPSPTEQSRNQRPPPVQTSPPSGPRGNHNQAPPTGPAVSSPSTRGPPSGPQAELPGQGNGRGRRHPISSVNNTLAQAAQGPTAPNGRGRGGTRQNSISYTNQISPSMSGPPNAAFNGPSQQPDLMTGNSNPNGMPVQPRTSGRPDSARDDDRRQPRGHHSERNDRDSSKPFKQDDNSNTNRRDHRGGLASQHSQHQSRDHDQQSSRNGPGPGPQSGSGSRYPRGPNVGGVNGEDSQGQSMHNPNPRKHPRDDSGQGGYSGGPGRGGRMANDNKRPRRGGGGGGP